MKLVGYLITNGTTDDFTTAYLSTATDGIDEGAIRHFEAHTQTSPAEVVINPVLAPGSILPNHELYVHALSAKAFAVVLRPAEERPLEPHEVKRLYTGLKAEAMAWAEGYAAATGLPVRWTPGKVWL